MRKIKILIVDNHPDNGRFLIDYFRAAGHEADWTGEADAVLQYCNNSRPDVIILDMRVAGIGEKSLLELLRASFAEIPVISVSAELNQQQVDWAKGLGVAAYLAKPCSNNLLGEIIESIGKPVQ